MNFIKQILVLAALFFLTGCGEFSFLRSSSEHRSAAGDSFDLFGQTPPDAMPPKCATEGDLFKSANGGCQSCANDVVFRLPDNPEIKAFPEARATCQALGEGWDLPLYEEMNASLGDYDEVVSYLPFAAFSERLPRIFMTRDNPESVKNTNATFAGKRYSTVHGDKILGDGKLNPGNFVCAKKAASSCENPLVVKNPSVSIVGRISKKANGNYLIKKTHVDVGTEVQIPATTRIVNVSNQTDSVENTLGRRVIFNQDELRVIPDTLGICSTETERFKTTVLGCEYTYQSGGKVTFNTLFSENFVSSYAQLGSEIRLFRESKSGNQGNIVLSLLGLGTPTNFSTSSGESMVLSNVGIAGVSACQQLGDGFRLPTLAEWSILLNETNNSPAPLGFSTNNNVPIRFALVNDSGSIKSFPTNSATNLICIRPDSATKRVAGSWDPGTSSFSPPNGEMAVIGSSGYPSKLGETLTTYNSQRIRNVQVSANMFLHHLLSDNKIGVITRYQNSQNYYEGQLACNASQCVVSISRISAGTRNVLGEATLAKPLDSYIYSFTPGVDIKTDFDGGKLELKSTDSKHELLFNGKSMVVVTDSVISEAGLTGIVSNVSHFFTIAGYANSAAASFSNFQVYGDVATEAQGEYIGSSAPTSALTLKINDQTGTLTVSKNSTVNIKWSSELTSNWTIRIDNKTTSVSESGLMENVLIAGSTAVFLKCSRTDEMSGHSIAKSITILAN